MLMHAVRQVRLVAHFRPAGNAEYFAAPTQQADLYPALSRCFEQVANTGRAAFPGAALEEHRWLEAPADNVDTLLRGGNGVMEIAECLFTIHEGMKGAGLGRIFDALDEPRQRNDCRTSTRKRDGRGDGLSGHA
jgi:hypothetical protein